MNVLSISISIQKLIPYNVLDDDLELISVVYRIWYVLYENWDKNMQTKQQ